MGHNAYRINYKNGFDLDKKEGTSKLGHFVKDKIPKHGWVSLPCTRLTGLVNLTPRDEVEQANFQKRQFRDLRRADEVVVMLWNQSLNMEAISAGNGQLVRPRAGTLRPSRSWSGWLANMASTFSGSTFMVVLLDCNGKDIQSWSVGQWPQQVATFGLPCNGDAPGTQTMFIAEAKSLKPQHIQPRWWQQSPRL